MCTHMCVYISIANLAQVNTQYAIAESGLSLCL